MKPLCFPLWNSVSSVVKGFLWLKVFLIREIGASSILTNLPAVLIIYLPVSSSELTLDFMQSG
jgi:hypothetical protein